jgi:hypothetical protein
MATCDERRTTGQVPGGRGADKPGELRALLRGARLEETTSSTPLWSEISERVQWSGLRCAWAWVWPHALVVPLVAAFSTNAPPCSCLVHASKHTGRPIHANVLIQVVMIREQSRCASQWLAAFEASKTNRAAPPTCCRSSTSGGRSREEHKTGVDVHVASSWPPG